MKVEAEEIQVVHSPAEGWLTWRRLVLLAGVAVTVATGLVSLLLADLEGGAVTVGFAVATLMTRVRRGTVGALGLVLVSVVTLSFMSAAAVTNIRTGSGMEAVLISAGLAAISLLAVMSALGFLLRRDSISTRGPRVSLSLAGLILVGLMSWGAFTSSANGGHSDTDLVSENVAFSETNLSATAGEMTLTLENKDLFWHTFTITELDVDLWVPVGARLAVSFDAPPGVYEFFCAIPGHREAGMVGTLRVEG